MLDVTNCPKIQDENRGVNEKLWIDVDGRPALFKKTQIRSDGTHTNAHFAEKFVSDICKVVGMECAEIDIAKRGKDIGCISYSFLREDEELVDFIALIQNIRTGFDSKKMMVPDTNEKYSVPLILEAIEEECSTKEEFDKIKKEFMKSCIIDSLIEHYDRNPSNISVIRDKTGIRLAPMFDNGTSLNVSVPREVVEQNLDNDEWMGELREKNKSKIGVEGERYSNYDRLLEYILSNYYGDVKEFIDTINSELTPEKVEDILSEQRYDGLDDIHKQLIIKKLSRNRENLIEQSKKYELKYQIEKLMGEKNTSEELTKMAQDGSLQSFIPEIKDCINCPQRSPYHIYSVDGYMFKCIENINELESLAEIDGFTINLSDKDKRLVQWAMMFNEMGKPQAREEVQNEDGSIRDIFRNYSNFGQEIANKKMEELNFYETERETVIKLIASHDKRSLDSTSSIKRFIDDVGEKNLDLYFAMKIAETNAKNPKIKEKTISELKELKAKIEEIQKTDNRNIIKALPQKGKTLMGLGLKGPQIGMIQQELANYVRENENMFAYYKARGHLEKYRKELIQYGITKAKEIKHREKAEKLKQSMKESQGLTEEIKELQTSRSRKDEE